MKQIKAIFQFFLAFFVTLLVLVTIVWGTLFREQAILGALEHSDYYASSVAAFNQRLVDDARPSGFPLTLFEDFVSAEEAETFMKDYAIAMLRGEVYDYPLENYKVKMHALLSTYMEENNIKQTLAIQQGVQMFVDDTAMNYRRILRIPFLETYGGLVVLYQKLLPFVLGGSLAMILFVLGMLYKLNTRNKRFLQDVLISTMAAGWMIVLLPSFLLISNAFGKIAIEPLYFGAFLKTLIHTSLGWMILIGGLLLLVSMLIGLYNGNRMGVRKKKEVSIESASEVLST